ncbi:hypothetical protein RLOatenuis_8730 [Rickettsiales bacterium]|nr:hypothetical protein RLOatenuis_8730 [Rickettsiales bacterium]
MTADPRDRPLAQDSQEEETYDALENYHSSEEDVYMAPVRTGTGTPGIDANDTSALGPLPPIPDETTKKSLLSRAANTVGGGFKRAGKYVAGQAREALGLKDVIKEQGIDASGVESIKFNISRGQRNKIESITLTVPPDRGPERGKLKVEIRSKRPNFFTNADHHKLQNKFREKGIKFERDVDNNKYTIEIDVVNDPNWEQNLRFALEKFNVTKKQANVIVGKAKATRTELLAQRGQAPEDLDVNLTGTEVGRDEVRELDELDRETQQQDPLSATGADQSRPNRFHKERTPEQIANMNELERVLQARKDPTRMAKVQKAVEELENRRQNPLSSEQRGSPSRPGTAPPDNLTDTPVPPGLGKPIEEPTADLNLLPPYPAGGPPVPPRPQSRPRMNPHSDRPLPAPPSELPGARLQSRLADLKEAETGLKVDIGRLSEALGQVEVEDASPELADSAKSVSPPDVPQQKGGGRTI